MDFRHQVLSSPMVNLDLLKSCKLFWQMYACVQCILFIFIPNSSQTHSPHPPTQFCVLFFFNHQVRFVLPIYSWMCGLPLEHNGPTWAQCLPQIDFPFPSNYPLLVVSQLGETSCPHPSLCCKFIWPEQPLALCELSSFLRVHMCNCPDMSGRHCFLGVICYWLLLFIYWLFYSFAIDSYSLSPRGKEFDKDILFRAEYSKVSHCPHIV